jgi:2-oxoglutarate dehydrogenase complex dehydrogenase (E1) component-like enzyme
MKELDPSLYGLGQNDELESLQGLLHGDSTSIKTLSDVRSYLSTVYCGSMAVDFSGIEVNFLMKHPPFLVKLCE